MIIIKNIHQLLKKYLPENPIIIEAGAFNGKDTLALNKAIQNATIHAFEPVPEIFAELTKNTASIPSVNCYQYALSDKTGITNFYISEHPNKPGFICQAGTMLKPKDRLLKSPIFYPRMINVPTITLDDWAIAKNITRIDFLWFDMQGNELAALKGSYSLLKTARLLYIEVNFIEAYENQPSYQEIDSWIINQGFLPIAKDFEENQNWFFGNILYHRINSI